MADITQARRDVSGFMTAACLFLLSLSPGAALAGEKGGDAVVLKDGRRMTRVSVLSDGYKTVEVDRDGDGEADEHFPASDIAEISYGDAPGSFLLGAAAFNAHQFAKAITHLERSLKEEKVRRFWLEQQANYMIGESRRNLAEGDRSLLPKARAAFRRVVVETPEGRMAPAAIRGIGLCYLEEGDAEGARREFEKLADGDEYGEEWACRGKLLLARLKGRQGKHKEAMALCKEVLDRCRAAKRTDLYTEARFARAELLVESGKYEEAHEAFRDIAKDAREKDFKTQARTYNGIGDALLGAKRTREALLAYLRVRVLYFQNRKELPRALFGAARCFTLLRKADEARELVGILRKEYPASIWTVRAVKNLGGVTPAEIKETP